MIINDNLFDIFRSFSEQEKKDKEIDLAISKIDSALEDIGTAIKGLQDTAEELHNNRTEREQEEFEELGRIERKWEEEREEQDIRGKK